ncbi:alpha/beta fold hydrolase [Kribbella sp. NPDC059898]|uniref:alpha/beta fold hydrolase n=1 Tax=Kribbella sp. NPDC059898 TaxID=3346995 RepID=UPI00366556F4
MTELKVNSQFLGLKDVKLHVHDYGPPGRPVVLIHGWPLSGASWAHQVTALSSAGLRVITYDRRGFGRSDKPRSGYDYDTLTDDLAGLLDRLDLWEVSLIGFSMGGGEVARYVAKYGESRLHSVVFAAAVTPMMMKSPDNPEGPLDESTAAQMNTQLKASPNKFYEQFTKEFFSANADGELLVDKEEQLEAVRLCGQADKAAALAAMQSFGTTDFRDDLTRITVPTLVIHGDADGIVPLDGSGRRTHEAVRHSELAVVQGAPHGLNVSHAGEFNRELVDFLARAEQKV